MGKCCSDKEASPLESCCSPRKDEEAGNSDVNGNGSPPSPVRCCICVDCPCKESCDCGEFCQCPSSALLSSLDIDVDTDANDNANDDEDEFEDDAATEESSLADSGLNEGYECVELKVEGMTCSHCAGSVSNAIRSALLEVRQDEADLTEHADADVSWEEGRATVSLKKGSTLKTELKAVVGALEDVGYDASPVSQDYSLDPQDEPNMTCTSQQDREAPVVIEVDAPAALTHTYKHRMEFGISGMTCVSCERVVASAIRKVAAKHEVHVASIQVSATTEYVRLEYSCANGMTRDVQKAFMQHVVDAITSAGYQVHMDSPELVALLNSQDDANADKNSEYLSNPQTRAKQLQQRQKEELGRKRRAFLLSLLGAGPILFITMILSYIPSSRVYAWLENTFVVPGLSAQSLVLFLLCTPVQFGSGATFYVGAFRGMYYGGVMRGLGMDMLVVVGTTASYVYATLLVIMDMLRAQEQVQHQQTGVVSSHDAGHGTGTGMGAHFYETSAVLISFVLLGKWMQARAVRKTSNALTKLMSLQARTALLVRPVTSTAKQTSNIDPENFQPGQDPYTEVEVPTEQVQKGDIVKVIRGASIPVDGTILHGEITVNESMITGESFPVLKTLGADVLGGTVCVEAGNIHENDNDATTIDKSKSNSNTSSSGGNGAQAAGAAFIKVTGVGSDTALSKIVRLVEEAQMNRAPIQDLADTISSFFVPTVVFLSLTAFLVWLVLCLTGVVPPEWYKGLSPASFAMLFGLATLVISCPCALGLAVPTAVMVGTGVGASHGILIKGGGQLQKASQITSVVFDKTGTLTHGRPQITDFIRVGNTTSEDETGGDDTSYSSSAQNSHSSEIDDNDLLWLLGCLERNSEHPLASSIVNYVESSIPKDVLQNKPFVQPAGFRAVTGRGVSCRVFDESGEESRSTSVAVGNRAFHTMSHIAVPTNAEEVMVRLEHDGKTAVLASVNGRVEAVIGIADEIKQDSASAISYLRSKLGVDVWLVTGDNRRTAAAVAKALDLPLDRVIAEALPAAKLQKVKDLQACGSQSQRGGAVAMIGDGVNDSPALAQADVGISIGTGAEIATEAADMVLVAGDVGDVCVAIDLARTIFRRIRLNFVWALIYNCLGIPIAMGVLYPAIKVTLPPTLAAVAMALSSLSVVASSLALKLYKPPDLVPVSHAGSCKNSTSLKNGNNLLDDGVVSIFTTRKNEAVRANSAELIV